MLTTAGRVRPGAGWYLYRLGIPRAAVGASGVRPCSPLGDRRRNLGVKQRRRSAGYRVKSQDRCVYTYLSDPVGCAVGTGQRPSRRRLSYASISFAGFICLHFRDWGIRYARQ